MVVKSIFTVILYIRPKLFQLALKNFSEISDTKGGEPIFQVLGEGKKEGGEKIFPKS